jgi:hypothetical protein
MTFGIVLQQTYEELAIDTTTAMQIVEHTFPQMWKRYNQREGPDTSRK